MSTPRPWILLPALAACAQSAEGLFPTPDGDGPVVVVDWDRKPIAEVPFPSDLATKTDITSRTGLRLNLPTVAGTDFESEVREKINDLEGFGVYQAITVSFDAGLDVQNLVDRHPNDFHTEDPYGDDAILLIDVDPDSPEFGQAKALDLGHGRYPYDVFDTQRYFANDPRAGQPALIWETGDEDTNKNGILDPGEDTDGDGLLDFPNVWPEGGDVFEDLLSFYDRQSYQLVLRPVVPLRENTTYAVVLTNRLVDEQGQPIRSPWPFVHHTRQTGALDPLRDFLPDYGLDVDDIAFAWTYTTGVPTADLRDLRTALYEGTGPFKWLQPLYPAGFTEGLAARDEGDRWSVSVDDLLSVLEPLGALGEGPGLEIVTRSFRSFTAYAAGMALQVPYLLKDVDDGGTYDAEEWFKLDAYTGSVVHESQRLTMLCSVPKAINGFEPPFDVFVYGHGYGSNRVEALLFGAVLNRFGYAVCSTDAPGHGATVSPEEFELASTLLELRGIRSMGSQLFDGRQRDLDNDGSKDSGGDQWSADTFHTRDMVRQAVVDWMQVFRSLRACGTTEMLLTDYDAEGKPFPGTEKRVSCDWDGDGVADIGGPDAHLVLAGGSLGGINVGVAAGVLTDVDAFVTVVPGGGVADVGLRTSIGGAVEAFIGRFVGPLIVGLPDETGLSIVQLVNSVTDMDTIPLGHIETWPAGGSVRLTNLRTGEEQEVPIPADGRFRVAVATDGMDPGEKRLAADIPLTGPVEGEAYEVDDVTVLGDELLIEILDATGVTVATLDTLATDIVHEGVTQRAGTPIVAGSDGNGKIRGSVEARRLALLAGMVLEPGDPIAYAPHWFQDPFPEVGENNVLIVPTVGDSLVSINAGMATARAAGLIEWQTVDERYGMTVDAWLIDRQVVRGVEERGPYIGTNGEPCLFDPDDLDDGTDGTGAPSDAPLRSTRTLPGGGVAGLRIPYVDQRGSHAFALPEPDKPFDMPAFALNQLAAYLTSGGTKLEDRACYATFDCPEFPPFPEVTP